MQVLKSSLIRIVAVFVVGAAICLLAYWSPVSRPLLTAHAQVAGAFLSGYAWSENIGWIQMYSVDLLSDASTLSGYAWSENIGWISFNQTDLTGCPSGTCKAWLEQGGGQLALKGWARACAGTVNGDCTGVARTDGWDGWIALNDQTSGAYGPKLAVGQSDGAFTGYSWGSDVVGWIDWSPSYGGVSLSGSLTTDNSLKVTANPTRTRKSTGIVTLTWTGSNIPLSCTISRLPTASGYPQTASSSPTTGNTTATNITTNTVFTVDCGSAGSASVQVGIQPAVKEF